MDKTRDDQVREMIAPPLKLFTDLHDAGVPKSMVLDAAASVLFNLASRLGVEEDVIASIPQIIEALRNSRVQRITMQALESDTMQ